MKELIPSLQAIFEKGIDADHVIFTGSSSGGAVASLLFYYFAFESNNCLGARKRSLITFGSPPVTAQNLTTRAEELDTVRSVLAFVNEGDVVTRLCLGYIESLMHLYKDYMQEAEETRNLVMTAQVRELPVPSYYQIGRIVLLRSSLESQDITTPGCLELSYADFSRLLWCGTSVHKGSTYSKRVAGLVRSIDEHILPPQPLEYGTCVPRR